MANTVCAVGVAFNAKIAGLKVLDGPMTDSLEAEAFTKNIHKIDVYSCRQVHVHVKMQGVCGILLDCLNGARLCKWIR